VQKDHTNIVERSLKTLAEGGGQKWTLKTYSTRREDGRQQNGKVGGTQESRVKRIQRRGSHLRGGQNINARVR